MVAALLNLYRKLRFKLPIKNIILIDEMMTCLKYSTYTYKKCFYKNWPDELMFDGNGACHLWIKNCYLFCSFKLFSHLTNQDHFQTIFLDHENNRTTRKINWKNRWRIIFWLEKVIFWRKILDLKQNEVGAYMIK